ncbi:TMV resistance protein N-like [Quercus lobata]|uniref:ADP-ribosyl cyclase/cyclic ADP-ribose hydrolase n=1 Tax=Quercus lobata TaxID=97700 RepID=A0A7N2RFH5_QUELO|nr:TMV resistance protein N-like [Quercus lobata]
MASASSSSLTRQWEYDVFLSFNREDESFASELYDALAEEGIKICRDDDIVLDKETALWSKIFTAIENSRFSVIILYEKYAFSDWCLEKLAKIVECQNEIGQTILPVLLDVYPSEVRNQTGKFGEAFELQVEYFEENLEVVKKLRAALIEVSNIPGWIIHHK